MPRRDLRNLPDIVTRRLSDAGQLDGYGLIHRGNIVESGHDNRSRPAGIMLECRAADTADQPVLDGYASVYDVAYEVLGGKASGYGWDETIVGGAAAKSISERDDVYWLFDHEGLPVASTKAGTLDLTSDKIGILAVARPDMRSQWNNEVVMRVQSGEIDAMSFAFTVVRQEWNSDYTERFITELKMWDVSGVKNPANPATHVHARADVAEPTKRGFSLALAQAQAESLRLVRV